MSTPVGARVVGWNCIISMSFSGTPTRSACAMPSPVHAYAFVVPDVQPARAARAEDHRLCLERDEPAVHDVPADDALAAAVVDHELPGEPLVVDEQVALHDLLVEHLQQHVAGDVGRVAVRGSPAAPKGRWAIFPSSVREKTAPQCSSW